MSEASPIADARTFLFVPGDRPDRFAKAWASGADVVVLDLEDAVAPAAKEAARRAVADWLDPAHPVAVRINGATTPWWSADVALQRLPGILAIMQPKAEDDGAIAALTLPVIALVESARGVEDMRAVARLPQVVRMALGAIDLALDLDMTAGDAALDPVRLQMVIAARAAGLPAPIAGVSTDFADPARIAAEAAAARRIGFGAKLCIHPAQIGPTRDAFRPTAAEVAEAYDVIAASEAAGGGAIARRGQMLDAPVVGRARRVIAAHLATASRDQVS